MSFTLQMYNSFLSPFPSRARKSAFTLIELLCVIAIIGLLSAILFPVFARARDNARRTVCQSNLKQMGIAVSLYNADYDGIMMPSWISPNGFSTAQTLVWPMLLQPYTKNTQIFACPSAGEKMDWGTDGQSYDSCWGAGSTYLSSATPTPARTCYSVNWELHNTGAGKNEAALTEPSTTASILDGVWIDGNYDYRVRFARAWKRHMNGINVLYADGHVKWMRDTQLENLRFAL